MSVEKNFEAVAREFVARRSVDQAKILHAVGLRVGGKFFAFVRNEELVVKLPAVRVDMLLADGRGRPFRSGARVMREWVVLKPRGVKETMAYVREAHDFVAAGKGTRKTDNDKEKL
jgi:hypothetical protein